MVGNNDSNARIILCKSLGIRDLIILHGIIIEGRTKEAKFLLQKRLNYENLNNLGYNYPGMKKLGYNDILLDELGYKTEEKGGITAEPKDSSRYDYVLGLLEKKTTKAELRQKGILPVHCKNVGVELSVLARIFELSDVVNLYSLDELKRHYLVRDLEKFFSDAKLSKVFSVDDMRLAGRTVRQLRRYYTDNQIISARFSHLELIAEGLPVRTSERRAMNK